MPAIKVRQVLRWLRDDGWLLDGTAGSHRHFRHPSKPGLVTVPDKANAELNPKTYRSICKQAGWGKTGPRREP
ncbi:MAG: type II toxin-antitoxin system HicA family toxin [Candidatus Baltobacteraceae bacterium]